MEMWLSIVLLINACGSVTVVLHEDRASLEIAVGCGGQDISVRCLTSEVEIGTGESWSGFILASSTTCCT